MSLDWLFKRRRHRRQLIYQLQLLNMNLSSLQTAVTGVSTSIDAAVAALGSSSTDQATIDSLTIQLTDAKAKLDAALPAAAPTP